jgi:hypothetical protein
VTALLTSVARRAGGLESLPSPGDRPLAPALRELPANGLAELTPNDPAELPPNDPAELTPNDPAQLTPNDPAQLTPNDPSQLTPNDPAELTPNDPTELPANRLPDLPANGVPEPIANRVPELPAIGLAELSAIGLAELSAAAALQTRRDRKYLLPPEQVGRLLAELPIGTRVLQIDGARQFGYESVYFDTADLASYLLAAHRRPRRFKVRSRLYTDSRLCQLEVKTRDRRRNTVKRRADYPEALHGGLTPQARAALGSVAEIGGLADGLRPALVTRYRRSTLLQPDGSRLTLDEDVTFADPSGRIAGFGELTVVETKSAGPATPVDRLLWRHGWRPIRVSKYATGLALLRPELPANRWHRALGRIG